MSLRALLNWARNLKPWVLILFIGAMHGGLYLAIVPPWQHYDEPTHFEYAWWLANHGKIPKSEDYDANMRREVAASMVEHQFFDNLQPPNLLLDKVWIGISQTNDPPLYYFFAALPIWLLKGADVATQLQGARFVSYCMFLLTLWFSYLIVIEIFPEKKTLHRMIPLGIALTPAFVDLMTAVNNDVGATLAFTIFLWMGTKLVFNPFSLAKVLGLGLTAGVCAFTKNTVYLAVPMGIFLLLLKLSLMSTRWRYFTWAGIIALILGSSFYLFIWEDAADWYRGRLTVQQDHATRAQTLEGNAVLNVLGVPDEKNSLTLSQPLTAEDVNALIGKSYTLGAWMWASAPVEAYIPALVINGKKTFEAVQLTTTPTFFSSSGTVPENVAQLMIFVAPFISSPETAVTIYFDDLVLVEGEFPATSPPTFTAGNRGGRWANQDFLNFVRNASMDAKWLTLKPAILLHFQDQSSLPLYALPALQDLSLTFNYYKFAAVNLFESYWARFGWNHVALPQSVYIFLGGGTLLGLLATLSTLPQVGSRSVETCTILFWFALCAGLIWVAALARQGLPFWDAQIFTPSARYAYPAILPTAMSILLGWQLFPFRNKKVTQLAYFSLAFLIVLDITSLLTLLNFYHFV